MPLELWGLLVGATGTVVVLRSSVRRRGRRLRRLVGTGGVAWAALSRVIRGGEFLDRGRERRGVGPGGTLLEVDDSLEWRPARHEARLGDAVMSWPTVAIACVARKERRDVTGLRVVEAQ